MRTVKEEGSEGRVQDDQRGLKDLEITVPGLEYGSCRVGARGVPQSR